MRSSKSRSRNKSNRQRSLGNIVNRVFDSSGPEGKVRGTPQQIIEKYLTLARDAQLSNDRVAEQSFLQHAEHYTRLLGEAQREQAERQSQFSQNRDDETRDDQSQNDGRENGHGHDNGQQNGHGNGNGNGNGHHNRDRQNRDHNQQPRHEQNAAHNHGQQPGQHSQPTPVVNHPEPVRSVSDEVPVIESGLPPVIAMGEEDGPVLTPEAERHADVSAPEQRPRQRRTRAADADAAAATEDAASADKPARRPAARRPAAAPRARKKADNTETSAVQDANNEAPGQ